MQIETRKRLRELTKDNFQQLAIHTFYQNPLPNAWSCCIRGHLSKTHLKLKSHEFEFAFTYFSFAQSFQNFVPGTPKRFGKRN